LRQLRRRFQMIFQDPFSSLNPRTRAGAIVREPLDLMAVGNPRERADRVAELFAAVGLRPDQQQLFPHQFSGGQRQRIGIARALATHPDLIVCDEPVSALDVAIRSQILNLLVRLQREFGLAYLFISHDLGVVQYMCDDIAVMYLGRIIELTDRVALFRRPLHPYTWTLLSAIPGALAGAGATRQRVRLRGDPPSAINPPSGCHFSPRCPFAEPRCRAESPALREVTRGQWVACHLVDASGAAPHEAVTPQLVGA
jgi:peptide/nickel transport system ATP-binding protein